MGIGRFEWERTFERVPTGSGGIKPTTKYVGFVLARYATADTGRRIYPGRERLAAVIGKSVRTIDGALDELCDVGFLELVKKGGRGAGGRGFATEYRLTLPSDLTQRMTLLNLDRDDLPLNDHSQPTASDESVAGFDQSQPTASDDTDQLQPLTPSGAVSDSISRNGLHPINQLHQSTSTNRPDRKASRSTGKQRGGEEDLILQKLAGQGLDSSEARAVLEYTKNDPATISPRKRLQQSAYLRACREAVKTQHRNAFEAGPKCENHPWAVATNCGPCAADEISEAPDTLPLDDLVQQAVEDFRLENPGLSARELAKRAAEIYQEMKGRAA
ncbi:helix-turn-helix domain-containing protein [Arthrobacter sp. Br18]|uniref:helix-turn-helix domain-containing protein n=1 Tax=Arthrobacter sp. Br18 TaxID=1312954 RepID=UPI0012DBE558|nr:helix-turn-helix domain-containing protein [Arthrobacter sp. Br18]